MKTDEIKLEKFGEFLNTQGYNIDLSDDFWMEDCRFGEHKVRDIFELCQEYSQQFQSSELLDEEIINHALEYVSHKDLKPANRGLIKDAIIIGAKWYKEQLRKSDTVTMSDLKVADKE